MRLNPNVSGINVEKTRRNSTGGIHDMYEQGSSLIKEGMHLFGLLLLFGKKSGLIGTRKVPPYRGILSDWVVNIQMLEGTPLLRSSVLLTRQSPLMVPR